MTSLIYLDNGQAVAKEVAITCYNQMPQFIFHKDCEGVYTCFNDKTTLFTHNKHALDLLDTAFSNAHLDYLSDNEFELFRRQDELVLSSGKAKQFISMTRSCTGKYAYLLGCKKPLFHPNGALLGLTGSFTDITCTPMANAILLFLNVDKAWEPNCNIVSYLVTPTLTSPNLSEREFACLFFFIRHYTIKMTAHMLGYSPKTVSSYLERIKYKLGCQRKEDILGKSLQLNIHHYLPQCLLSPNNRLSKRLCAT